MESIKPTIGRILHYNVENDGKVETAAAIITKVFNDTCVNLQVFLPWGTVSHFTSVKLTATPEKLCANWPPRN